ncbi:MAG: hypothetical protein ACOH5I_26060 [Oligoflexus sp.]
MSVSHQIKEVLQKVALKKELSPSEWIIAGNAIFRGRKRQDLTQVQAAKKLKITRRKLQKLEAAGRWSKSKREYILQNEGFLSQFHMKLLTDRSWPDTKTFKNAVDRIVDGKKLRKKRIRKPEEVLSENGPDRFNEIQILTESLKTRVDIQGQKQGQIIIYFHNWEQYERLREIILN